MLIAQQKKKENIAEYILYMWQVEDLIRACDFSMKKIYEQRIEPYPESDEIKQQMYDWYDNLVVMMQKEQTQRKGHLQFLKNNVEELTELHFALLHKVHDVKYQQLFFASSQALLEVRQKSKVENEIGDVELGLTALYGVLMLRISGKDVSEDTAKAIELISKMMAYLSMAYSKEEEKLFSKN